MKILNITRICHASVLLNFNGLNILTDPWFSQKRGYYSKEPRGIQIKDLPTLDAVVVSHGHYDHYDVDAFKEYHDKNVPFIVKKGIGQKAKDAGFNNVIELDHWESHHIGDMHITATPAKHGIPENTYLFQTPGMTVFFGADTLLIPELSKIKEYATSIDVALLPVNGLMIRPLLNKQVVMTAQEAAHLCSILNPRIAIPIHYAFTGGWLRDRILLKYNGTPQEFSSAVAQHAPKTTVKIIRTGEPLSVPYNNG